jgi:hypothetical protein
MKKIHITLIGGQLIPTFKGIVRSAPDFTYLVHTFLSEKDAEWVESNLEHPCQKLRVDSTDIAAIKEVLDRNLPVEGSLTINITAATKPMAFALYEKYKSITSAKIFYLDQSDNYVDLKTQITERVNLPIPIETWVTLQKQNLKSYSSLGDFDDSHKNVLKAFRALPNKYLYKILPLLAILRSTFTKSDVLYSVEVKKGKDSINYDHINDQIYFEIYDHDQWKKITFQCKEIYKFMVLTQWFELEIAEMLRGWKQNSELLMSLVFPYQDNLPKNEIDIAINLGNKILTIECKTQLYDIKDIDKFRNATRIYFGTSATPVLITEIPLKKSQLEKCRDAKMLNVSMKELAASGGHVGKSLIQFLEININQNNRE